jgi:hypothetical protein
MSAPVFDLLEDIDAEDNPCLADDSEDTGEPRPISLAVATVVGAMIESTGRSSEFPPLTVDREIRAAAGYGPRLMHENLAMAEYFFLPRSMIRARRNSVALSVLAGDKS